MNIQCTANFHSNIGVEMQDEVNIEIEMKFPEISLISLINSRLIPLELSAFQIIEHQAKLQSNREIERDIIVIFLPKVNYEYK